MQKIGVVIPTLNEEKTLDKLLASLNSCKYKDMDIAIVDGGSTDKTKEIAFKHNAAILIEDGEKSPANARNQGAIHFIEDGYDIIAFIDADCTGVSKNFFHLADEMFDNWTAGLYIAFKNDHDTLVEKIVTPKEGMCAEPTFIRGFIFKQLGGFPNIGYGEDYIFNKRFIEHCIRTRRRAKKAPEIVMTGHGVQTLTELWKQKKWYGRTSRMFLKEHK